ncbi:prolyl oligopeptidase family serine peptidase [Lujinxingia vulgaris]|uniref:Prolyl oligopeptidase family serine peptidase n=1 Tax=Lujinxingia vulgaris TaxID=2600176 RepID=A0A5C6XGD3_9DELT|nr:prolyl oligopeptidase family serine peptidase [Lujinxingia vulgaris]TXD36481.1 prolyl oligopeptidase family serine peptidase [Lujinxingia vulgaris]
MQVRTMWWLAVAAACVTWVGCGTEQADEPVVIEEQGPPYAPEWDGSEPLGGERAATVALPANYSVERRWPLVIALHGFSASPGWVDRFLGLSDMVDDREFIAVLPPGTVGAGDLSYWNATEACCDFADSGVDDVAYLSALIDEVSARLAVDPERIYFMGHSNGGFMAYRMACELSDRIRAVTVVAGSVDADPEACQPTHPVSVLHVHGDEDEVIPYGGGALSGERYPGAEEVAARWAGLQGCEEAVAGEAVDVVLGVTGAETEVERWQGCQPGASVELWSMRGAEHNPTLSTVGKRALVDFLLEQR